MLLTVTASGQLSTLDIPGARIAAFAHIGGRPNDPHPTPHGLNFPDEWLTSLPTEITADGITNIDPYMTGPYIDAEGRVAILAWAYGDRSICHNADPLGPGICWKPTPSPTGNRRFHQGTVITASGVAVPAGGLMWGHVTASSIGEAQQLYNHPELFKARGRILEIPGIGAYFVGGLQPGVTNSEVEVLRASALSGDWRHDPELGHLDALGPVVVARPGLPSLGEYSPGNTMSESDRVFWELVSQFQVQEVSASGAVIHVTQTPAWAQTKESEMNTSVMAAARQRLNRITVMATGLTARARHDQLREAVRSHLGLSTRPNGEEEWLWINTYDNTHVFYETDDGSAALAYSFTDTAASVSGDPIEVFEGFQLANDEGFVPVGAPPVPTEAPAVAAHGGTPCGGRCGVQATAEDGGPDAADFAALLEVVEGLTERLNEIDAEMVEMQAERLSAGDIVPDESGDGEDS